MTLIALTLIALLQAPPQESLKELQAVFETSAGSFIIQFYPDQAPNHVRKFLQLAREGYFDGTAFHSMVSRAVVQGGDPETRNPNAKEKYGSGGYNMGLKREISDLPLKRGTIVAFTLPDKPDSAGSQFFICIGDQPELDFGGRRNPDGQGFAAFGRVTRGREVVQALHERGGARQFLEEPIPIREVRRV